MAKFFTYFSHIYAICEFPKLRKIDVVGSVSCVKPNISQAIAVTNTVCEHLESLSLRHLYAYRHL